MTTEPTQYPHIDPDPDSFGSTPHLADYWSVVARRLGLVMIIFTVTAASSIWAISQQETFYSASMALQVNDPEDQQAGLVNSTLGGMNLFVDPIVSEVQVLSSGPVLQAIVDSLGLRLVRDDYGVRSDLARNIWVDSEAPDGLFELWYDAEGLNAQLRNSDGELLVEAPVGTTLDAGFMRFVPQRLDEDTDQRLWGLRIEPAHSVAVEIGFSSEARSETNIVDIGLVHADQHLAPLILNMGGKVLRERGAESVRSVARQDRRFIQSQLDSADAQMKTSQEAIRVFKTTQAFSSLSLRQQQLVARSQRIYDDIELFRYQRQVLSGLVDMIAGGGIEQANLTGTLAELPEGTNNQVHIVIQRIQAEQEVFRELVEQQRLSKGHPQVQSVQSSLVQMGTQLQSAATASLGVVTNQLAGLEAQEQDILDEQALLPALEGQLSALEAQRAMDASAYQMIQRQLYQTRIAEAAAAPYIEIIDPATAAHPLGGSSRLNILLGGLLGIILGVGAAFFLEYLDRTVRTSSDVESLLGIPVLGVIPQLHRLSNATSDASQLEGRGIPLIVAMDPLDPASEAYRNLRMNLMYVSPDSDKRPTKTVLFSSPGPSEGKSTTAVNFAVMLAQQGHRVLLIDSDLRRPSLHRTLDLLREPGLTNLLIGDAEPRETVRPNVFPNLDFLPSGVFPPNPSELLNSKAMVRVIEEFEGRYDFVVIDSPPLLAVTDAAILSVHTDGAVIVLRSGETEQRAAQRSIDQLRRLGVRIFGAVLNEVTAANPDESYYLQYYETYTPTGTVQKSGWQQLREGLSKVTFFG
ncbi:MAG: polysaccharide biosynthesis tyrosine autokinase [Gemmatimonadales bacterium]|jgi:capsular exopolysaccharide synthesis family protein|nr:polysaccharide biosynthesis tyrosine autokinase [Gemmatimonadales bacterium]